MHDLITVIIPTYNRASMLKQAIESVRNQDYPNIEIIVVDDASTDDTADVVQSLGDQRIRYFRHEKNSGGAATTRNTGLREAKGKYIAFLDTDDEFVSTRLARLHKLFNELMPQPAMIFTNAEDRHEDSGQTKLNAPETIVSGFIDTSAFPASVFCPTSCWMVRADAIKDEFFDEKIWVIEDCDFFARMVRKNPVYFLNESLLIKHVHSFQGGRVPIEYAESTRERMLEKWLPEMRKDKHYLTNFYCTMGKDLLICGKTQKARDYLWQAFLLNPFNFRVLRKFLKACFV